MIIKERTVPYSTVGVNTSNFTGTIYYTINDRPAYSTSWLDGQYCTTRYYMLKKLLEQYKGTEHESEILAHILGSK